MKLRYCLLGGLVVLLLAACNPVDSFMEMVGDDSLAVAWLPRPLHFLQESNRFLNASGLNMFTGGRSLQAIAQGRSEVDLGPLLAALDMSRPVGIIVHPGKAEVPEISMLLPVKDEPAMRAWFAALPDGKDLVLDGPFRGFLILRPAGQSSRTWPPAKHLDRRILEAGASHHVVLACNGTALASTAWFSTILGALDPAVQEPFRTALGSSGWTSLSLGGDAEALIVQTRSLPVSGSSPVASTKDRPAAQIDTSRLSQDEILGFVSSRGLAALADLPKDAAWRELFAQSGSGLACSLDYQLPPGLLTNPTALSQAKFSLLAGWISKDRQAWTKAMQAVLTIQGKSIHAAFPVPSGENETVASPAGSVDLVLEADQIIEGQLFDRIRLKIGGDGLAMLQELDNYAQLYEARISWDKHRAWMALGNDGAARLASWIKADVKRPLSASRNYATLAARLDKDAHTIGHLAVSRILNQVALAGDMGLKVAEDWPGLLFSASTQGDIQNVTLVLASKELQEGIMQALPLVLGLHR